MMKGIGDEVRALCVCPLGLISSSRDKSIKIWKEVSATGFELDKTLVGHTDFVSTLAWMPPGLQEEYPVGALVSGSRDKSIIIWDQDNGVVAQTLKDHEYQVSSLGILEDGSIVSASLDKSLKIWKQGKVTTVLNGHEAAVLCVLVLPNNHILSGSGDKSLKVWANGQLVRSLSGHADTVRGLALLPGVGVVSASHDQTLRVWTLDSNCVGQMIGHTAIVYCCAVSENGLIASGSEDNTARVWRADGTQVASIMHPGCVWAVAFLPNEDLVTGCSDGIVRIWSTSEERKASDEDIAAMEGSIAAMQEELLASQKGSLPPGLNIEDPSVLLSPGNKDGANKIVKEGGGAVVYSWSAEKGEWEKIGDVMGDGGGEMTVPSKTYHKGREWDYAFDVDVADGQPMLKLCMNAGDNPYLVAERFLIENNLPNTYLDQIIQFIMAKTEHLPVVNVDPLTGGQSYVPRDEPSGSLMPPQNFSLTGGGCDPLTGSGFSMTKKYHFSPKESYVYFDMSRPVLPMVAKIQGFSAELPSESASAALTEQESSGGLEALLNGALRAAKGEDAGLEEKDYILLQKLMTFPHHQLFPVLDVCRMLALDVHAQGRLAAMAGDLLSEKPGILGSCILNSDAASGHAANQQMALQFLVNCFKHPNLKAWILNNKFIILERYRGCCEASMKNTRHALSTLILNIAVAAHIGGSTAQEGKEHVLEVIAQLLTLIPGDDHESGFRVLVAAGTLALEASELKTFAKQQGLLDIAQQKFQDPATPAKLKHAIEDLKSILH